MLRIMLLLLACVSAVAQTFAWPQDSASKGAGEELEKRRVAADAAAVERLMGAWKKARKEGDAVVATGVLGRMGAYTNPEFVVAAREGLAYRASKVDQAQARELAAEMGIQNRKEVQAFVLERESSVQEAAARVMAAHKGNKAALGALTKAFKDKAVRKSKPKAMAAVILALGELEHGKIARDVFSEFKNYTSPEVGRACVRYFGLVRCKDKSVVRELCAQLSAPEPGNVNSPTNPPASYWESRWKAWNAIRRDISWSLKEITGQVFKPAEGDFPGDTKKALDYIKNHGRELGIR